MNDKALLKISKEDISEFLTELIFDCNFIDTFLNREKTKRFIRWPNGEAYSFSEVSLAIYEAIK